MIRFLPDTWRDTLLRPLAMAAPDGGVYIEIMAPDFRFVFVLVLLGVLATAWCFRRRADTGWATLRPAAILLGVVTVSFVPWLATTGNGRYFMATLLAVGPLCMALVWLLPTTRGFRLSCAVGLVALQVFALQQSSPWHSWGLAQWKDPPYFGVEVPPDMLAQPATYVTIAPITYSLIAPRLPAQSRWMSLANAPGAQSGLPAGVTAQNFLDRATGGRLALLAPVIPDYSTAEGMPTAELVRVLNTQLARHRLELAAVHGCRLLPSRGLVTVAYGQAGLRDPDKVRKIGFWVCPLKYPVDAPVLPSTGPGANMAAVFSKLEQQCPRFFAPGQTEAIRIPGGEMRIYSDSEMKVYVFYGGTVLYKYYRTLNPVTIGTISDVLSGKAKVDCGNIRGRSGLPWEREI